jgi:hypothetical protein
VAEAAMRFRGLLVLFDVNWFERCALGVLLMTAQRVFRGARGILFGRWPDHEGGQVDPSAEKIH